MKSPLLPHDTLGIEDISASAIKRWRLLVVACAGLMILSYMAWTSIARREEPKIETAVVVVSVFYPGASPEDVESQVVKVIEQDVLALDGILSVDSLAFPSQGQIFLEFRDEVNVDIMVEKIRGRIAALKNEMPAEVREADVSRYTTTRAPQMVLALAGNRSDEVLTEAAKKVKERLSTIPGVSGIDLRGDRRRAVRVQLDPVKLSQYNLSAEAVVQQLQLANVRIPAGEVKIGPILSLLQVNQEFSSAAAVMKVPVGASVDPKGGTQVVSLGDVAQVKDDALTFHERFIYNGQPGVALELRFRATENAVKIGDEVRRRIAEAQASQPEGTAIYIAHDQPSWVSKSILDFLESLIEGVALVMTIITLGMGWRAALVVAGVLPLAAGGAIFGLYVLGFSLDQISIAGLIVALGLLVDDAVVVTESIQIMRDKGLGAVRAAVFGTARVFWANNGTTAVACASFVPLFFMSGPTGQYIRGLPVSVILSLVTSLLVAQFFTPWAATFLLRPTASVPPIPDSQPFDRSQDSGDAHEEHNPVIRYLKGLYARRIFWILDNPLKVIGLATAVLIGSFLLLPMIGFEFFPKADKPMLFVTMTMPRGTREEITAEKTAHAINIIQQLPQVESTSAIVGGDYPRVIDTRDMHGQSKDYGEIFVRLKKGFTSDDVAGRLRVDLAAITGVKVKVEDTYYGPPTTPITVRIFGEDYAKLRTYAEEVQARLREEKGAMNVRSELTETIPIARVMLDADKARRVGITPGQVGGTLRWLYGEDKVTEFRLKDERIKVVIEPRPSPDSPLDFIEQTPVPSPQGAAVPLRQAGQASLERGFAQLARSDGRRVAIVMSDVDANTLPADVIARIDPWMRAKQWEPGYSFKYGGQEEKTAESFKNLGLAAVGAMLLIFVLLVLMSDSLTLSTVIMLAVPYAMIGAVSGLGISGNPFGFMSFLGMIALIGVYVNHKIYFVDRMQELMHRGLDLRTAILHAGQDRLRPVVLTALTAILGLVPLTLGGGPLWGGFGWVNILGLVVSVLLSLVVLPAFISLAFRLQGRHKQPAQPVQAPFPEHAPPVYLGPNPFTAQGPSPLHGSQATVAPRLGGPVPPGPPPPPGQSSFPGPSAPPGQSSYPSPGPNPPPQPRRGPPPPPPPRQQSSYPSPGPYPPPQPYSGQNPYPSQGSGSPDDLLDPQSSSTGYPPYPRR